jgi:hypothetical protein
MAFREWETFFLGTARRNGGMKSRREGSSDIDHEVPNMVDRGEAKRAEGIATSWRGIDKYWRNTIAAIDDST